MAFDGREVANFALDFSDNEGRTLSNLALQKVIYFCHVWSLIDFGTPLVKQKFEAWQFGPVLPYLHRQFKHHEKSSIIGRATRINAKTGADEIVQYSFDSEKSEHLQKILSFYTRLNTCHLVELSHVQGGPWDNIWNHSGVANPGMKIDDKDIIQFYSKVNRPFSLQ